MKIRPGNDGAHAQARADGDEPLLLSWIDPQSGAELSVEMWGPREFAEELVELGFEVRTHAPEDESVSSLFVVIRQPLDDDA